MDNSGAPSSRSTGREPAAKCAKPAQTPPTKAAQPHHCPNSGPGSSISGCENDPHALLDPDLLTLRAEITAWLGGQPAPSWRYMEKQASKPKHDPRQDALLSTLLDLRLVGSGAQGLPEAVTSRLKLAKVSGFYRHMMEFGKAPNELHLETGHAGLALLVEALYAPQSLQLTVLSAIDLLQAALYLQIDRIASSVLSCLMKKLPHTLYPALLRLPAVLGLGGTAEEEASHGAPVVVEIHSRVEQLAASIPAEELAPLLVALPRREALLAPNGTICEVLQNPTECHLLQVLCDLSKLDEGFARSCLARCPSFLRLTSWEQEAAGLYLQSRQDIPLPFASAALLSLMAAYQASPIGQPRLWATLPLTQHGAAAWGPTEGHVSEGVSLQPSGWGFRKVEYREKPWRSISSVRSDHLQLRWEVTPADPQVPGSEMQVHMRPVLIYEWPGGPVAGMPQDFCANAFAFTTDGFIHGRLGPMVSPAESLQDRAFLRRAVESAFVCLDGRRRLLVGIEGFRCMAR